MTDKYTLEEIRDMVGHFYGYGHWDENRDYLTRPKHQFREGEVMFVSYLEDDQPTGEYLQFDEGDDFSTARPLRLSEMPAAVSELRLAMRLLSTYDSEFQVIGEEAQRALAAFDEAVK